MHVTHHTHTQKARQTGYLETHYVSILHTKHVNMLQLYKYAARGIRQSLHTVETVQVVLSAVSMSFYRAMTCRPQSCIDFSPVLDFELNVAACTLDL